MTALRYFERKKMDHALTQLFGGSPVPTREPVNYFLHRKCGPYELLEHVSGKFEVWEVEGSKIRILSTGYSKSWAYREYKQFVAIARHHRRKYLRNVLSKLEALGQ